MKARIPFVAALLYAALAGPPFVDAQQASKIPRIGYISGATPATGGPLVEAFKQGLRELGYVEGKTYVLEVRYSEGRSERLPELAHELVGRKVDVIVGANDAAIAAIKRETQTIPTVMTNSIDPVGTGFVAKICEHRGVGRRVQYGHAIDPCSPPRFPTLADALTGAGPQGWTPTPSFVDWRPS